MDKVFICVFAVFTIATWISGSDGSAGEPAGPGISVGLSVRAGEPAVVIAQKNGELLLNCSVQHDPELGALAVSWTQDGEPVDLGGSKRVQVLQNGSLYIRRVIHRPRRDRSDGGRYRCLARLGDVGTIIAREVTVQVAGIDRKFEIEPQPQVVPLGGVARFQCKIQAVPPAMYLWERNGTMLPQNNNRYLILSSGILQITGVNQSDVGRYKCYVTQGSLHRLPGNDIDTKYSSEATLDIDTGSTSEQVQIVASSRNETALLGSSALLECLVQGNTEVTWLKDGTSLTLHRGVERIGNNLQFLETELTDHGQYQCVAGNSMVAMTLNIMEKPVVLKVTPESRSYPKSQWIYLDCEVGGSPKPSITWLKDGKAIPLKDNRYKLKQNKQLVIVFSNVGVSGFYQCIATNPAGSATGFTRLEIYTRGEEAEKPTNVTLLQVTKTDIKISWSPPASDTKIVAYTVHYIKEGDFDSLEEVTQKTVMELNELSPFSEYAIKVSAFTERAQGHMSDELVVRTLEDVPSRPPTISLTPGASSIRVRWDQLPDYVSRGVIAGNKLYYRRKGGHQAVELTVPGSATEYDITGLEPKTDYEVRVNAGTSVGYNSFTDNQWPWVDVRTIDDMYVQLSADSINATAVNVSWLCQIDTVWNQFLLEVRHLPDKKLVTSLRLPPDTRHYAVAGLEETTLYEITLDVERADGQRGQVVEEFRTSNVPLPPTPRSLHATLVNMTNVRIAWIQAESLMEIMQFTVRYSRLGIGNADSGEINTLTSETSSAQIEGLLPYTQYRISVQAHSQHTASKFSSPLVVRTKEGVPSEPQNIQIATTKPGHISLAWSPPATPNGQIRSYVIMYASSLSDDDATWHRVTKNGTERSAVITLMQTAGQPGTLYFKLLASTTEGLGTPSPPISVNTGKINMPITDEDNSPGAEQRTGIIIGISIGGFCIVICVFIVCCRHRILSSSYNQQPQTQPARFHGNGHIPGNGNGHAVTVGEGMRTVGVYEMEAYTPMLQHVPENEDSDSKGGGGGNVILTPNGTKLNGFVPMKKNGVKNGGLHNGHHITPYICGEHNGEKLGPEETRGLIASMLNGVSGHCMTTGGGGDESFPSVRYDDLGSLDDIDRSSYGSPGSDTTPPGDITPPAGERWAGGSRTRLGQSQEEGRESYGSSEGGASSVEDNSVQPGSPDTGARTGDPRQPACPPPPPHQQGEGWAGQDTVTVTGNELPHAASSPGTSSSCEDTCHDGGTGGPGPAGSGPSSHIPQLQHTTSTYSQALRAAPAARHQVTHSSSSDDTPTPRHVAPPDTRDTPIPHHVVDPDTRDSPALGHTGTRPGEVTGVSDVHSSSNGFLPQLRAGGNQTQGETRMTSAENNPTIPLSPPTGEVSLSHGARETTLDKTLAHLPQDEAGGHTAAMVKSSSWKNHYQV